MLLNETVTSGTIRKYKRCRAISIENPMNGVPTVMFQESIVTEYPDGETKEYISNRITIAIDDMNKIINIVNPLDGSGIGQTTTGAIYAMLFSLWKETTEANETAASTLKTDPVDLVKQ